MEGEREEGGGLSVVPEKRDGARRGGVEGEGAEEKAFGAELLDEGERIPSESVAGRDRRREEQVRGGKRDVETRVDGIDAEEGGRDGTGQSGVVVKEELLAESRVGVEAADRERFLGDERMMISPTQNGEAAWW